MVPVKTIGLVNGTSFEGADTALLETDGVTLSRTGPSIHRPYSTPERILLRQTLADRRARARGSLPKPNSWSPRRTRRPSNACSRRSASIAPKSRSLGSLVRPCCIGPLRGLTVQIGDGPGLARRLGIPGGVRFPGCRRGCRKAGRHWSHALAATPDRAGCSSQHWPRRQRHLCRSERRCRYRSGNAPLDDFMHARTGKSAFAYRAVRMLQGVPITFPGTTGASPPTPGERRGSTLDRRSDVTGRLRRRCCRGHP